jgi:hypothetical protein
VNEEALAQWGLLVQTQNKKLYEKFLIETMYKLIEETFIK